MGLIFCIWAIACADRANFGIALPYLKKEYGISVIPGGGVANGSDGDLIVLAPAYNVTAKEIDLIVDRTAKALESVLGPTKRESKI